MKTLLAVLAFFPLVALADHCPVLTGTYMCTYVTSELVEATVAITIVTEGHKYTISAPGANTNVVVADGEGHSTTTPALEGVIVEYSRFACVQSILEANYRTSWYHDGHADETEVAAIDEIVFQKFSHDNKGNLVEWTDRKRLYLGNNRHPEAPKTRVCPKQ